MLVLTTFSKIFFPYLKNCDPVTLFLTVDKLFNDNTTYYRQFKCFLFRLNQTKEAKTENKCAFLDGRDFERQARFITVKLTKIWIIDLHGKRKIVGQTVTESDDDT